MFYTSLFLQKVPIKKKKNKIKCFDYLGLTYISVSDKNSNPNASSSLSCREVLCLAPKPMAQCNQLWDS